jgi:hypothetical protein
VELTKVKRRHFAHIQSFPDPEIRKYNLEHASKSAQQDYIQYQVLPAISPFVDSPTSCDVPGTRNRHEFELSIYAHFPEGA